MDENLTIKFEKINPTVMDENLTIKFEKTNPTVMDVTASPKGSAHKSCGLCIKFYLRYWDGAGRSSRNLYRFI